MKNKNNFFVKVFLIFSLFIFCNGFLFSQSILSKKFYNYFDKENFVKFPNWKNGFVFLQNKNDVLDEELFPFNQSDDYEIKFSYLPRIPISEDIINENSIYKYQQDMQMRMFKSDESLVALQKNPLGQTTRVYKDDSLVKQKKYDEKERIFEEKIWKNDSQGFTLLSEKKHKYKSDDDKFAYLIELIKYDSLSKILEFYNENNYIEKRESFSLQKILSEKKSSEKKDNIQDEILKENLISTEFYFYDLENRITEYICKKNNFTVNIKYDYKKNLKNPDEVIFENEIKKSEKIFSSDFDYTNTIFLDENYSIKTVYKNSIKVEEHFYLDGKKIRSSEVFFYEE